MSDEATPESTPTPAEPAPETPPVTPRYEWGPEIGDVTFAASPTALADVQLTFDPDTLHGADDSINLEVPPHDPATHLAPARVHVLFYAQGSAFHGNAADAMAAAAGGDPVQGSVDIAVTDPAASTPIKIERPAGVKDGGQYSVKVVLEFHA